MDAKFLMSPAAAENLSRIPFSLYSSTLCLFESDIEKLAADEDSEQCVWHDDHRFSAYYGRERCFMGECGVFVQVYSDKANNDFYIHDFRFIEDKRCPESGELMGHLLAKAFSANNFESYKPYRECYIKHGLDEKTYPFSSLGRYVYTNLMQNFHELPEGVQIETFSVLNQLGDGIKSFSADRHYWYNDKQFYIHIPNFDCKKELRDGVIIHGFYDAKAPNFYYIQSASVLDGDCYGLPGHVFRNLYSEPPAIDSNLDNYAYLSQYTDDINPSVKKVLRQRYEIERKGRASFYSKSMPKRLDTVLKADVESLLQSHKHSNVLECLIEGQNPLSHSSYQQRVFDKRYGTREPSNQISNTLNACLKEQRSGTAFSLVNFLDLSDPMSRAHREILNIALKEVDDGVLPQIDIIIRDHHGHKTDFYDEFVGYWNASTLSDVVNSTPAPFSIISAGSDDMFDCPNHQSNFDKYRVFEVDLFSKCRDASLSGGDLQLRYESHLNDFMSGLRSYVRQRDNPCRSRVVDLRHETYEVIREKIRELSTDFTIIGISAPEFCHDLDMAKRICSEARLLVDFEPVILRLPPPPLVTQKYTTIDVFRDDRDDRPSFRFSALNLDFSLPPAPFDIALAAVAVHLYQPPTLKHDPIPKSLKPYRVKRSLIIDSLIFRPNTIENKGFRVQSRQAASLQAASSFIWQAIQKHEAQEHVDA